MIEFLTILAKVTTCGVGCSIMLAFGLLAIHDYKERFADDGEDF